MKFHFVEQYTLRVSPEADLHCEGPCALSILGAPYSKTKFVTTSLQYNCSVLFIVCENKNCRKIKEFSWPIYKKIQKQLKIVKKGSKALHLNRRNIYSNNTQGFGHTVYWIIKLFILKHKSQTLTILNNYVLFSVFSSSHFLSNNSVSLLWF